jgi:hypothetical protein
LVEKNRPTPTAEATREPTTLEVHLGRLLVEAFAEGGPHRAERAGVLFADRVIFGNDEPKSFGDFLGHALMRAELDGHVKGESGSWLWRGTWSDWKPWVLFLFSSAPLGR